MILYDSTEDRGEFQMHVVETVITKVIVPRGNWTRLVEMVKELHRNYSASGYVFRNNYFFLDLPSAINETSNVTFVRHRLKVGTNSIRNFHVITASGDGDNVSSFHIQ